MTNSTNSSSEVLTEQELRTSLTVIEIKKGIRFSRQVLAQLLDTPEDVLFFGQVYDLDANQVGKLMVMLFDTDLVTALFGEAAVHSTELQDYIVGLVDDLEQGELSFDETIPAGQILPEVWKSLEIEVAQSIKDVATKLGNTVALLPGKNGHMVFKHMMALNRQRPQLGDYKARIAHARQQQNLLILDVSGSMTSPTVQAIVDDVVALSYQANAHMAIVSDHTTHWEPGGYDTQAVLNAATYGGTHYETLAPLFQSHDWGTVITVADYDSSHAAKNHLARAAKSRIGCVVDVSLVNRPTYLAECVGQLADEIKPILVGNSSRVMGSSGW